eukprot:CAMPEP_0170600364 /NCGR_PEP_ID=MMETSP0224-20130122/17294_1 /TAXON_ID=285029 /ORGANISM="Togula jolla, Strain CCCM 725" /LENGTH=310 /DNA_ID=CAMNT_0010925083 /DNA_START=243 /DNA_END=1175 /DNA_ORIENTATION=-
MAIFWVVTFILIVSPTVAFVVLCVGILTTTCRSRVRWPPVVYWAWWPSVRFWSCVLALVLGMKIGNYLWENQFEPYQQMMRLQAYNNVNPSEVQGVRLQDAGIALFNETAGVDRGRTGCLKNGPTYCIAPIVKGGQIMQGNEADGQFDLFMAGTDCCSCPGEFRCGQWDMPSPVLGGVRIVDSTDNQFYKLAAEAWSGLYGKPVRRPIFFKWVADPVKAWGNLRSNGVKFEALALLCIPLGLVLLMFIANGLIRLLNTYGWAAPMEAPLPPPGLGRMMSAKFLPNMHRHQQDAEAQQGSWTNPDPKYVIL